MTDTSSEPKSSTDTRQGRAVATNTNRVLLENYFLPGDLEVLIDALLGYYNQQRYHVRLKISYLRMFTHNSGR